MKLLVPFRSKSEKSDHSSTGWWSAVEAGGASEADTPPPAADEEAVPVGKGVPEARLSGGDSIGVHLMAGPRTAPV